MRWFASLLLLSACAGPEASASCDDLSYETFGEGYLRSWCTGCHHSALEGDDREGAPEAVNLDTHEGALEWLDRVETRATGDEPTMPPVGGADAHERERFAQWLQCGAP